MPRLRLLLVALALATAAAPALAPPASATARTPAVVVLGDSAASGEGAGDYAPGTRGEQGDWCHRSPHAYINATGLTPVAVNLACSGATSADVAFGSAAHYTEGSQAQQLVDVAERFRVTTVVLQVGANDDAALTGTGIACIRAFLDLREPPCRDTVGPLVPARMAATATKVEGAVRDVQEAMHRAGYAPSGYQLVLTSYAAPITENMVALQAVQGCPFSKADAGWGRTVLFPALSAALRGVAQRTGARFLDLDRATEGYEACTHSSGDQEWQRRLTVDPAAFAYGGLDAIGYHLGQESFHPSAAGHAEMGRCLGDFVRTGATTGACVAGVDGHDHLDVGAPVAVPV
ncbi:GDSL-type esterase/lipase family protein [Pseudonocardia sp. GCM10023141]|uniref:GDSL-type esterase/lipase family protein n=1 Tax=Pseudonocardia sp. GCM10023141 TaxID=3252653 RepID=UPI0036193335